MKFAKFDMKKLLKGIMHISESEKKDFNIRLGGFKNRDNSPSLHHVTLLWF